MTHTYNITGMTCGSCVAKVKSKLLMLGDVENAEVKLESPQAIITMQKHIDTDVLQSAIGKAGNYTISDADSNMNHSAGSDSSEKWFQTYKPVLLIVAYITVVALIGGWSVQDMQWMEAMRIFMAAFFLTFSFFKMLDIRAFADSYSMYDIVSKQWKAYGFIYPFIELGLGILFAIGMYPVFTNVLTLIVMSISLVGVLQSVLNKRKIQCACLGAVFKLPMSTITVIEDGLMILMSGVMLFLIL